MDSLGASERVGYKEMKDLKESEKLLEDKAVNFFGKAYPNNGWCVILCGGSWMGKSTLSKTHILIDAKKLDVDDIKTWWLKTSEIDGDYIKTVTIKNEQPTATIIIDKSVALRENADTSLVDVSDLSGIQFKLIAKTDITDKADGSVVYKANQVVGTYNLDKKGNLKIEKLLMGEYQIEEIKTLPGLVLNNTKYDFKY